MADTKITALTALTAADPINDVIPIVDVSDTSMAASGTTKKISVNNILGASGTATLASATITGDLTVRTNKLSVTSTGVGVGTVSPNNTLTVRGTQDAGIEVNSADSNSSRIITAYDPANTRFYINSTSSGSGTVLPLDFLIGNSAQYRIAASGVFTWYDGAGGTRMTLNATGLGVGGSPSRKLSVSGAGGGFDLTDTTQSTRIRMRSSSASNFYIEALNSAESAYVTLRLNDTTQIDASGNCGIGVTPSALNSSYKGIQVGGSTFLFNNTSGASNSFLYTNAFQDSANNTVYRANGRSSGYLQLNGEHRWFYDSGTQIANANCAFTQAMTLDASGNLLVGTTTAAAKITALAGASGQAAIFQQPAQNFWCVLAHNQATSGDNSFVLFGTEASFTSRGSITYNRAAGQVSYNITSDYRLKEDVKPLTGALNRISSLKPSTYKFKETGFTCEGFIAHELAEVIPAAVTGEKDAVNEDGSIKAQGVDLSKVVPVLVAAIKELAAEVNALKNA